MLSLPGADVVDLGSAEFQGSSIFSLYAEQQNLGYITKVKTNPSPIAFPVFADFM